MLSLGSRDDGRKEIGLEFRSREGAMEENELEEGEAFSGHEDDACIDPDIALSYIDEKLQDVLGHFQKDFEGGVSAENLGAKFGGYGSFLPSYQRSPSVLSQPRSPPRAPNNTTSRSPYNSSVENPSVPRVTSVSKTSTPSLAQSSNPSRKENCISSASAGGCVPDLDSNNKPVNVSDQKSLKVRIKVGPDNTLVRSNAAIYSGLGLDTSPSSSPEDGPDASAGLSSPELRDAPGESPLSILQVMTCFSVPGGYLLSPLHENLFQLTENESLFGRKSGILGNGAPEMCAVPNMTLSMRDMKGYSDMKIKLDEKNFRSTEEENLNCKGDTTQMLKKEMDVDAPGSKRVISSALNMSLQPCSKSADFKAERQITGDAAKGSSRVLGISKEPNRPSVKDRLPLPDSAKDDQCIPIGSMKSGGVNNLLDRTIHAKGKLNSKTSLLEKDIAERNPSNHNDISSDTRREGKSKNQRSYDLSKLNGDEYKGRNDHVAGHAEPMKQMPAQKVILHEKDAEKMPQVNDQVHKGKKGQKGSHNNSAPSVESIQSQRNPTASSSLVPKEKKKSSHARGDHSENKSKMLKSHKETNRGHSREFQGEVAGNANAQRVQNIADLSEPFMFTEKSTERSGIKKDVNLQPEPMANPPVITSAPISDEVAPLDAPPVVIKENWVFCDKCQKWRLLPYGADPNNLPKEWKCSMQVWLPPGLNKCSISEEETQKAFNALYMVPAPETSGNLNGHHDGTASNITSTDAQHFDRRLAHDTQSVPTTGKKKSGLINASNVPKNSVSKKNLQSSIKNRSSTDVSEYPVVTNSSIKAGLGLTSKSVDFTTEKHNHKQKEKHEIPGHYSGGGDFVAKSGKHSKSKSKREVNQDGFRTSKKVKKENLDYLVEDQPSDLDMTGKAAPDMDNSLSAKVTGKILQNYSDHTSSKDSKSERRGNLSASIKNSKDPVHIYTNGDFKGHFWGSDVDKSDTLDYAAKKRKVKEWQESQVHQETIMYSQHALDSRSKEAFSEGELRKQKKARVSKSEGKESSMSNVDGKIDKKGRSTKILLSGSREQRSDGTRGGGRVGGKEQTGYQETAVPRQALDANDPLKREMTYALLPTAATSSSSKVSGSRKSKANLQEARGSPVESVSSSPLRISTTEKIFIRRNSAAKDDMVNLDPSFTGSPKRCSDGELGSDQSGTLRKETGSSVPLKSLESHRAAESGVLRSMRGMCHYLEKEASHLSAGNNKDGLYLKRGAEVDLSPAEFEVTNAVGDSENILGHDNKYLFDGTEKDNIDDDRDNLNNHHRSNGTGQRKSGESSGFKERNRKSNSGVNKGKTKASSSLSDKKELYSTKNGRNFHSEADLICNDDSNRHGDPRDENYNFPEKNEDNLGKKKPSSKWSHFDRRDNHSNGLEENLDAQNKDFNSRVSFVGANCKSNLQENLQPASYPSDNPASHSLLNHMDRSDMASVRGTSHSAQPPKDKSEVQNSGQIVPTPIKGSRPDAYPIDVANGDAFKLAKQSRKPDSEICLHPSSLRQVTPNSHDSSPMRKDVPSVASAVLKEARDLKHSANRLKTEGLDHESIGLYFEAALKFLYCASLLEPHSAESAKHGEMNPSMLMISIYSDTARLCEYCAHEYERYKEMAAAALAFKCIEVAYMKVAYYKHSAAIKDRHELLTALQTVLPGESPSSSASDIDNLNNQGAVDKAASAKAAGSPQIAGNHVIAARNRPNFMRLLSYANDLNCAFDATKRSQNAIAAASVSLEKDGVDGLSSVRKVLDFNFHNVEGLLRLVRLSMESISC